MEELRYKGTTISTTNQYFVCFYLLYFAVDIFINPLLIGISKNLITQGLLFTLTRVWRKAGAKVLLYTVVLLNKFCAGFGGSAF
ncbi:MAG: hypothetical protein IPK18_02330 [Sphingobacteriales bacterium]|nr:MAG: hypothetical protein IPK18_02330 [Sphingobacteriales bacterium]